MAKSERENLHDTAALRALAEGEVLAANIAPNDDELVGDDVVEGELDLISPAQTDAKKISNQARTAKFNGHQAKSAAVQFRQIAIPLLYVLGVILWCIGGLTLSKVIGAEPEQLEGNPLLENGILFSIVSIMMGFILIAGGIFFHHEVRKTLKSKSNQ